MLWLLICSFHLRIFGSISPEETVLLAIPAGVKLLVLCLSTQICEDNKLGRNVEGEKKKRLQSSELSEFDQPILV